MRVASAAGSIQDGADGTRRNQRDSRFMCDPSMLIKPWNKPHPCDADRDADRVARVRQPARFVEIPGQNEQQVREPVDTYLSAAGLTGS